MFEGEGLTDKNVRHCVNSISLGFVAADPPDGGPDGLPAAAPEGTSGGAPAGTPAAAPAASTDTEPTGDSPSKAYFAGGCFWGVEHLMQAEDGVLDVRSGYMGGTTESPTYKDVSSGRTGHAETVEVTYDPDRVTFERLAMLFFEIHDPTQLDRQGPDRGSQYRSAVFYVDDEQKRVADRLVGILREKGYDVVTEVAPAGPFWPAEDYHQDYYEKTGKRPYCHARVKRF